MSLDLKILENSTIAFGNRITYLQTGKKKKKKNIQGHLCHAKQGLGKEKKDKGTNTKHILPAKEKYYYLTDIL